MLLTCYKNRDSELLPKRSVFTGNQPGNAPQEAPQLAEARVRELQQKPLPELRSMLSQQNLNVQEKKVVVESLIGKIDDSNLPETDKKNLRKEITDTLTALESSSLDVMESIRLRFELAKLDSTPYSEALKIVWPSREAMGKLFNNLSGKTLEFFMLAVGFFQQLKTKISNAWENIKNGRSPTSTPQPQPNPAPQPERPPEGYLEGEKQALQQFGSIEMVEPQPASDTDNVYFKFKNNGPEWRMKPDGTVPQVKNGEVWSNANSSNMVANYLNTHKDKINNLFEASAPTPTPTSEQKRNVAKTLIGLQIAESQKAFPRNVASLINGKWERFFEANKGTYGNKGGLLSAFISNPTRILDQISNLPNTSAPQPAPTPAPQPAPTPPRQ